MNYQITILLFMNRIDWALGIGHWALGIGIY